MGTKQGRKTVKKMLEATENLEEDAPEFIENIHELVNDLATEGKHITAEKVEQVLTEDMPKAAGAMENLMDRIKEVTHSKKSIKKFFSKSGKIINP